MKKYPTYKDSGIAWIGQIPSHWKVLYLFQVADEHYISNKEVHHQNLLSLSYGKIIRKDINKTDGLLPASFDGYQIVEPGNIVLRLTDLQNDQRSLRVGLTEEEGIVTSAYLALQASERITPEYLYFQLHSNDIHKVFYGMGGGLRQGLNWNGLRHLPVILPPVDEQEAIVRYITEKSEKIDRYIAEQERLLAALDELRQADIARAVTRGLNPDTPLRDSGIDWIGSIPTHWEIEPMGRHFEFSKGLTITKANLTPTGVAVISYGQIHNRANKGVTISQDLVRYVPESYLETNPECLLHPNDFIFADTSEDIEGSGNCAFNDYADEIFAGYHTVIARPLDLEYPKYTAYLFQSKPWKEQVHQNVNAVKVYSINRTILKKTTILIPPLDEQRAIVEYLDAKTAKIDRMKADIEKQICLLKEYKQRMISDAVTGKIDVRE